jgi:OmpA-OmpF porin, OOP family
MRPCKPVVVRTIALAFAFALCAPLTVAPALAQSAAEVKRLLTTLAPRHQENMPSAIIVKRPVEIEIDGDTVIADYGYTLDFEVSFEFDSARLTGAAKRTLAALGRALESRELIGYHYLIAGHTDAKGSASYNRALSYERAGAVRDWLIAKYAIDPRRLHVVGWGESRLKTPRFPFAAVNRRVEVTLIVPAGGTLRSHPTPDNQPAPFKITPAPGAEPPPLDPSAKESVFESDAGGLPPCPTGRLGDPRDPAADLDDFGPRPGIDCTPPQGMKVRITPEGDVIIE